MSDKDLLSREEFLKQCAGSKIIAPESGIYNMGGKVTYFHKGEVIGVIQTEDPPNLQPPSKVSDGGLPSVWRYELDGLSVFVEKKSKLPPLKGETVTEYVPASKLREANQTARNVATTLAHTERQFTAAGKESRVLRAALEQYADKNKWYAVDRDGECYKSETMQEGYFKVPMFHCGAEIAEEALARASEGK